MTTFSAANCSTRAPPAIIENFACRVAALCDASADAMAAGMRLALRELASAGAPLEPWQMHGQAANYTRHLLHADPHGRFSVVAIVWQPGQATPVHGHFTWCGYAVVDGTLHEQQFCWEPAAQALLPNGNVERRSGDPCFVYAGLDQAHQLSNRSQKQAVSIHVYGVDSARVATHVNRIAATATVGEPA